MNNQNNGQYGYVNRDGRLVPTSQTAQERVMANAIKNGPRKQQTVGAKEYAGYNATTTPRTETPRQSSQTQQPKKTYAERNVEEAYKKSEKKQKNTGKGIKNLCLTLSLLLILSAAKQMPFNVKGRITELAAKNGTHNYMDDVFASDEKIEVINPESLSYCASTL